MRDAYIVTSIRTPGCKRIKGAFKDTRPEDLLSFILNAAVEETKGLEKNDVEDIMIGCSFPEAEQGLNIGRIASQIAGFPVGVTGATVNRFCASGLEAIALASLRVMAGWSDAVIGGGLESMTYVPMGGNLPRPHPEYMRRGAKVYVSMGITAENVANRYKVSRQAQDEFAYHSQMKAAEAKNKKLFKEMVPTPATRYVGQADGTYKKETVLQDFDDGIRDDTTLEGLAGLNPAFAAGGTVTAGNSSQMTGMDLKDVGLFEINEAFASQALHCINELGIDMQKVNIHGGAIALGHPLGCTGAKLCATLLNNMQERGVKYGVESMCIGGGMGAAALFELFD
jgi:acetyl-CoA acyltransferase